MFKIDFLGIGSGKSGSTWFFDNLVKHPEICSANPKEINFFSDLFDRGMDWYASNFNGCADNLLKGEFSVTYMYNDQAAKRIHDQFPDAKLIAIIRDPITRTYSDYWHYIRKGDIPKSTSFMDYIGDEKKLRFGNYADNLQPFFDLFPADQIKVIVLEAFSADHAHGFRDVYQFLQVRNKDFLPPEVEKRVNVGRDYRFLLLENIMVRSYRFLARGGHNKLAEWIKRSGFPEFFRKFNTKSDTLPPIPVDAQARLKSYFDPRKAELVRLTGCDLSRWM
jgi:hypothetical protein